MAFKPAFCAACGSPVVEHDNRFDCTRCGRRAFLNSKPSVAAFVVRDGRLLLVKRGYEPFKGWWDVPGGFLDPGEHPEDGVKRELLEETRLLVRPDRFLGVYMDTYGDEGEPTLNLMYECSVVAGEEAAGDDAVELGWFGPDDVPENVAFESARRALAEWRAGGQAFRTAR